MFEVRTYKGRIVLQLLATVLVVPFLLPLIAMVQGAFSGEGWGNFAAVLAVPNFFLFFRNSVIIAAMTIALVYAATVLAAFGFSKLRIKFKEVYFWLLLAAMTLPQAVLVSPLFATASALGLQNTYLIVVLPIVALQLPFAVLLTRTFIDGIPEGIFEAARVDGASVVQAFLHIVVPLTRPIAAAIIVLTLIESWNSYLLPLVFLSSPETQTITLVPQFFVGEFSNDQTKVLASAVLTALPMVVAYLLMQRFFERGLSAGSLK